MAVYDGLSTGNVPCDYNYGQSMGNIFRPACEFLSMGYVPAASWWYHVLCMSELWCSFVLQQLTWQWTVCIHVHMLLSTLSLFLHSRSLRLRCVHNHNVVMLYVPLLSPLLWKSAEVISYKNIPSAIVVCTWSRFGDAHTPRIVAFEVWKFYITKILKGCFWLMVRLQ